MLEATALQHGPFSQDQRWEVLARALRKLSMTYTLLGLEKGAGLAGARSGSSMTWTEL